jgi:hypothetical protein
VVERYPAIDLAPLELRDEDLAQRGVEPAQLVGQAELEVEVAMVDRAQLDAQRPPGQLGGGRREAGHAQDHRSSSRGCRMGRKREKVNEIFTLCAGLPRM